MKRVVFRVDDKVRVIIPKFVKRVGYPKSVADYLSVVDAKGGSLDALFASFGMLPFKRESEIKRTRDKIRKELAYMLAKADGFGGRVRSIHLEEDLSFANAEARIVGVRTVTTGTYFPPSNVGGGGYDYYDEWEPGGLDNEKRVRVASIQSTAWTQDLRCFDDKEIPVEYLEKLA